MKNLLKLTAMLSATAALAFTSSCAATKGLGQDLQKVGGRLEDQADATGGARPDPETGIYAPPSAYPSQY